MAHRAATTTPLCWERRKHQGRSQTGPGSVGADGGVTGAERTARTVPLIPGRASRPGSWMGTNCAQPAAVAERTAGATSRAKSVIDRLTASSEIPGACMRQIR